MALDQTTYDNSSINLPHPCPFPSHDVEEAKAWLADPRNQDLSAWDHDKSSAAGKWPILEGLIVEIVGIPARSLRKGMYAVCDEELGDQPTIKRVGYASQNTIIRKYTTVLRNQCKKEWRAETGPWIAAALCTWANRAVCLWKNNLKNHRMQVVAPPPMERAESDAGRQTPVSTPGDEIEVPPESCCTTILMRPVCEEYDEFVNFVVRNAEANGNINLQPIWPGYNRDPFDATAKRFRRAVKDRMIEDGILKQCVQGGSSAGLQLDHSVSFQDYPETDICRWINDYVSEDYGVIVRIAVGKIMDHCQLRLHGPYVPPIHRPQLPLTQSTRGTFHNVSRLNLVNLASSDCGEYLDFVNKVVRKALYFTYPQTVYDVDFQLNFTGLAHQRAEQLVGRLFRRMVKDNLLQHSGTSMLSGYDLSPEFEAKRFYLRRKLPSLDACHRLDTSNEQSLLRLEGFLDANVYSIPHVDLIRLYGSNAGSRFDELQADFMPKIKYEVIEDDAPDTDPRAGIKSADVPRTIELEQQIRPHETAVAEKATDLWLASYSENRLSTSSFGASSSSTISSSERPSYPPQEDMPSPPSDIDSSDGGLPETKSERDEKSLMPSPQPFDVKSIFQSKMKELERKRKLEKEASQAEASAPKRQQH